MSIVCSLNIWLFPQKAFWNYLPVLQGKVLWLYASLSTMIIKVVPGKLVACSWTGPLGPHFISTRTELLTFYRQSFNVCVGSCPWPNIICIAAGASPYHGPSGGPLTGKIWSMANRQINQRRNASGWCNVTCNGSMLSSVVSEFWGVHQI